MSNQNNQEPVNDQIEARLKKIQNLRDAGINPYPYRYERQNRANEIIRQYAELQAGQETEREVSVAGRIRALRKMGKSKFADLYDLTGKVQLFFNKKNLGKEQYDLLKNLDIGDIVGVQGKVFKTKRGETSINVDNYQFLCKPTRPLPDKYHGLKDPEFRSRHRSVDLIVNEEVKETFVKRTKAISAMREFLDDLGFLEVEIPTLQPIYGGASARPFTSHLNALGMEVFLSISPELYLKRLIVGGMEAVYTICKNFRNEGIDKTHNPEFTMMECYWSFADYNDMMELTENMYAHIFNKVNGTTKFNYGGIELDVQPPWERITMYDAIEKFTGINPKGLSRDELAQAVEQSNQIGFEILEDETKYVIVDQLFKLYVEENLKGPVFVTDHPKESTPLCKVHRSDPELIERFEPYIMGSEIGNAYSELNDPVHQRYLLEEQARQLREGDGEAHPMDEDFVTAIEYGMTPTGGLGLGIDRMVMFMTGKTNIREVILFPFMRPEK